MYEGARRAGELTGCSCALVRANSGTSSARWGAFGSPQDRRCRLRAGAGVAPAAPDGVFSALAAPIWLARAVERGPAPRRRRRRLLDVPAVRKPPGCARVDDALLCCA